MGVHKYENDEITVTWDSEVCYHSAVCVDNLKNVFNPDNKPWIDVDAETKEKIMEVIGKCPSGALQYQLANSSEEASKMSQVKITIIANGPYGVSGLCEMVDAEGKRVETKLNFALCRCGASKNKPFCDGTHKSIGFEG